MGSCFRSDEGSDNYSAIRLALIYKPGPELLMLQGFGGSLLLLLSLKWGLLFSLLTTIGIRKATEGSREARRSKGSSNMMLLLPLKMPRVPRVYGRGLPWHARD